MIKEASRVSGGDHRKRLTDGIHECPAAPSLGLSQQRLDLGESLFYRVEVRRVGRQEQEFAVSSLDQLTHPSALVGAEVVEHYRLTGA
jgi:hypothetical protein